MKFKVGDKVKVLDSNCSPMTVGETGVVDKVYKGDENEIVKVISDVEKNTWTDWGFYGSQLELVSDFSDTSQTSVETIVKVTIKGQTFELTLGEVLDLNIKLDDELERIRL